MLRRRLTREARRPPPAVAADSYDDVPYAGAAFPQTHPDRLVTLTRLYGGEPPDVENCSVLELGCGDGGNLVPMAYGLPTARFVGIDLNGAAVEAGVWSPSWDWRTSSCASATLRRWTRGHSGGSTM